MAASGGLPGRADLLETEEFGDPGPVPNKRKKIQDGEGNTGTEEEKQQRRISPAVAEEGFSASPAAPVSTPSPRLRIPPFPKGGKPTEVHKWSKECKRIRGILAKDPRRNLPTQLKPKDPDTADAVQSRRDKMVVRGAARSIVSVSSITQDGSRRPQCSGIIMGQREYNGKQRTIVVTCAKVVCKGKTLLDPIPKLSVHLPDSTILDGQLMFFNNHYDIALLEVDVDSPLECSSIGSGPDYGQKVFVLARDRESFLMARHGEILWLEESLLGYSYQMFLSCEVPVGGGGGPVIDHDGNVIGMAFHRGTDSVVLSISTIVTCIEMWLKFSRIARPIHEFEIRTIDLLDVSLQEKISLDHNIDGGFIVDAVSYDSAAESLGILRGDVIVSFDGQHALTSPQLEDYLLSLGWIVLNNSRSMVDIKLEVYDLTTKSKRRITLPVAFSDA